MTGTVMVDGQPAAYARLRFQPVEESQKELYVLSKADENGEFTLFVPMPEVAGSAVEYHVGVSWRIPKSPRDRNDPGYGKELLPTKFQDPKTSGLTIEIDSNMSELPPFEIKL